MRSYEAVWRSVRKWALQVLGIEPSIRLDKQIAYEIVDGWSYCPQLLSEGSTVVSVGPGTNIDFELELAKATNATVHIFDPTVSAEQLNALYALPETVHVHSLAISDEDGETLLYPTITRGSIQRERRTITPIHGTELIADRVRSSTLESAIVHIGQQHVDLLKLDIGGAEYDVLASMLGSFLRPNQLLVEFHHRYAQFRASDTERTLQSLRSAGYKLFSVSEGLREYSLLLGNEDSAERRQRKSSGDHHDQGLTR